jgi:hypothetical protein
MQQSIIQKEIKSQNFYQCMIGSKKCMTKKEVPPQKYKNYKCIFAQIKRGRSPALCYSTPLHPSFGSIQFKRTAGGPPPPPKMKVENKGKTSSL